MKGHKLRLRQDQEEQVSKQIVAYEQQEDTVVVKVSLGKEKVTLEIDPKVANPEIMNSGRQVTQFLSERPDLVRGKIVCDMGTGSGIIGIASARLGAKRVFMTDIDEASVANAGRNIKRNRVVNKTEVFAGDLFASYGDRPKANVQIFNHPFFAIEPEEGKKWTRIMLGGTGLIGRYFKQAYKYSEKEAIYILPWLTIADNHDGSVDNDPGKRAQEYGYETVEVVEQEPVKQGLQQAPFRIYILKKTE